MRSQGNWMWTVVILGSSLSMSRRDLRALRVHPGKDRCGEGLFFVLNAGRNRRQLRPFGRLARLMAGAWTATCSEVPDSAEDRPRLRVTVGTTNHYCGPYSLRSSFDKAHAFRYASLMLRLGE